MHVLIVGGGLAGLSAAAELGRQGNRVTILEARNRLGGRAGSFSDPSTGELVDACQHVAMGCCTEFRSLLDQIGLGNSIAPQKALFFKTPDRRVSRFAADALPAPLHLGRALLGAHYLSPMEKIRITWGLGQLLRLKPNDDQPLLPWLNSHRQTERTISRFWSIVLTSALNESIERIGTKYARKVFLDGFISNRDAWTVWIPTVPLGELYGDKLHQYLAKNHVAIQVNAAVRQLDFQQGPQAILRDGRTISADHILLAVPFDRVINLLPDTMRSHPFFQPLTRLEPSPITSVHIWTDRPFSQFPHLVFVESLGQWAFFRTTKSGESYCQIVVSAARIYQPLGHEELRQKIVGELESLFPDFRHVQILRTKVVTEKTATFSAIPGVDAARPTQSTPIPGLTLAGDWTQTDWPATMEGAVISGKRAAAAILSTTLSP